MFVNEDLFVCHMLNLLNGQGLSCFLNSVLFDELCGYLLLDVFDQF